MEQQRIEATLITTSNETHQTGNQLRDMILGGQDGLVNVLGVVLGAVAYTSFKAEKEHYESELAREKQEIKDLPEIEKIGEAP